MKLTRVLALLALFLSGLPAFAQSPLPLQGVQISNSSGNVAAGVATATLSGTTGKVTYICGFAITSSGSTAAAVVNATVNFVAGGTLTFPYATVAGAALANQPLVVAFSPCLSATAPNTAVAVSMPSLGAGNTNTAVNAWGYQR
jgi:hypothetical protein